MSEIIGHLASMSDRVPVGLLEAAAQAEMPDSARQADQELNALAGEVQQVMGEVGGSAEITGPLMEASAKLEQAAEAYGAVKMWLGDARDAAFRAQQAIGNAVAYHTR
ncbi:hypothetical protein [Amycolatopsis orientalis]|uniref:hypothetical protein n=1 Tax=Amycolatopsis orientalis TaxID=31958 RepID=UPI001269241C|nr:hypothetical protein [Amycolatopsis orientalis]